MNKYECIVCGLIYDEALGWPDDGIAPGTRWEDVPDDWLCPDCGVGKEDFELINEAAANTDSEVDADAPIVIVGTGLAGYGLAREIRKIDKNTRIILITQDGGESYSKPMLSTGFTKGSSAQGLVQFSADSMAKTLNADILTETRVTAIDANRQVVALEAENRSELKYSELVMALGSNAISPAIEGGADDRIYSINDLDDYTRFRDALDKLQVKKICVIGAGLIGCEYTNDLLNGGYDIQVVDALSTCLPTLAPESVGQAIQSSLETQGVVFHFGTTVNRICRSGNGVRVSLANGRTLEVDIVVSAIGVRPSVRLAKETGLSVNRGICTDICLRSSQRHIYAIGDCAEVAGLVMVYVAPLMAQARALAKTLTGDDTPVTYPAMPVTVKIPACPTVVAPPNKNLDGSWNIAAEGTNIKAEYRNTAGELAGFALTGKYIEEKRQLQAHLPPVLP